MTTRWQPKILETLGVVLIGGLAGLTAVAFHQGMLVVAGAMVDAPSAWSPLVFAPFVLVSMMAAAGFTGFLISRFAPDAPGSGIPQVKVAYHTRCLDFTWRLIAVKFLGGVLSIGTGSSLGREGPTIHIGAALASKVATWLREPEAARANAVCAGSAAGLAAAFSSPLAGVTLVLEEIAGGRDQNKYAGQSLLAAALAATVVYALSGQTACLPIGANLVLSWKVLWLTPVVAVTAGLAGLVFQAITLPLRRRMKASSWPMPVRLAAGAGAAGLCALAAFFLTGHRGVFGLGETDLLAALTNGLTWKIALVLLVAKLAATALCYGTGGCGGIFAPIIFFGAMAGVVVHGVLAPWVDLTAADQTLMALIGMTAALGAVVRAPITSILIVMEMTWQFHILPALMLSAVLTVFLNRLAFPANFYDEALHQDGVLLRD
jgi:chloride channel protein, CIC family